MCFETAGSVRSNGLASSLTVASPCAKRARMARRVEFDSTAKVSLSRSSAIDAIIGPPYFPYQLIYHNGNHARRRRLRNAFPTAGVPGGEIAPWRAAHWTKQRSSHAPAEATRRRTQ